MIIEIEKSNFWEHSLSSLQHSHVHLELLLIGRLKTRHFTPDTHMHVHTHTHTKDNLASKSSIFRRGGGEETKSEHV
jgi:hypothetical protein